MKYIDSNGNFTHLKVTGNEEEKNKLILRVLEHYSKKGFSSDELMPIHMILMEFLQTGNLPGWILMDLLISSTQKDIKFSDLKKESEILFELPPNVKNS